MRALVMAAGLGTRLKPLTDTLPKPLVPVLGRPMVAYVLEQLAGQGIQEAILNIHYFPEKMRAFAEEWNRRGAYPRLEIQDESSLLLDSGGSVPRAAEWLFAAGDTALICNADVLAKPDLRALGAEHARLRGAFGVECTLAVTPHPETGRKYNGLRRAADGRLTGFVDKTGTPDPSLFHFPGYYLLEKKALGRMPTAGTPFGVKEKLWVPLAAEGKLGSYVYEGYYLDLGTPADLRHAEDFLNQT
jgi:N-acetyl-alpha-D-muramate 1-phosphate uridylyltransferase